MSFITFDYKCPACGRISENRLVRRSEMDEVYCGTNCDGDHPTRMVRMLPATRTTFRFADTKLKD